MPFPGQVQQNQAPAVEGDFASINPRHSVLAGPGAFVAGPAGVVIGLFAWVDTATQTLVANTGTGVPTGIVHREMQGLITTYLTEFGMTIPQGFGVSLYNGGDFWVKSRGAAVVTVGMKAFANLTTGVITFAAAGATVAGAIETKWIAMTPGAVGDLIKISNTPLG